MKLDFLFSQHLKTARDYVARMNSNKVECMDIASSYSEDYWDGDRRYGYGGYYYDGRWKSFAEKLIKHYKLDSSSKVLDLGCGKGYLLYEIKNLISCEVVGIDISEYALSCSHEEVKDSLIQFDVAKKLPFANSEFDLVISLMTLHNLRLMDLEVSLKEIERVGKEAYIAVESYRNNQELFNLQCWALTCKSFFSPEDWEYLFLQFSYSKDFEFLFFE